MPVFDHNYMKKRKHLAWRASHICSAICTVMSPESVLDLGCATGDLVKGFVDRNVAAVGIDMHSCYEDLIMPPDCFMRRDICKPFGMQLGVYSLSMCIEVLGVVPQESWIVVLSNLVIHGRKCILCADPVLRLTADVIMDGLGMQRNILYEKRIREKLFDLRSKLAVKAFYNGLSIWEERK
jgi:hypothetical protein